jgi:hypothetical protein
MRLALIVLVAALLPIPARAATVDQIVALSKAGVSEPVILTLIDRDKTIFTLDAEQLVTLKNEGVSDRIVLAMLKSGRQEADAAARAEAALQQAHIAATTPSAPDFVVVGHGPDVPNAEASGGAAPMPAAPYVVPYPVPYPVVAQPLVPVPQHPSRRPGRAGRVDRATSCAPPAAAEGSVTARGVGIMPVCPPR